MLTDKDLGIKKFILDLKSVRSTTRSSNTTPNIRSWRSALMNC